MDADRVILDVNGSEYELQLEPRELLVDVLRNRLGLTGTHAACEQGSCGACTVLVDGDPVLSCLTFGVQLEGCVITTVESIGNVDHPHPVQQALAEHHGLQCGFCTPGVIMSAVALYESDPPPDRHQIERGLSGNICRCTGYSPIVDAIEHAVLRRFGDLGEGPRS